MQVQKVLSSNINIKTLKKLPNIHHSISYGQNKIRTALNSPKAQKTMSALYLASLILSSVFCTTYIVKINKEQHSAQPVEIISEEQKKVNNELIKQNKFSSPKAFLEYMNLLLNERQIKNREASDLLLKKLSKKPENNNPKPSNIEQSMNKILERHREIIKENKFSSFENFRKYISLIFIEKEEKNEANREKLIEALKK